MKAKSRQEGSVAVAAAVSFLTLQNAVASQFERMKQYPLFRVSLTSDPALNPEQRQADTGGLLWKEYIAAFPEGTNPKYKERTDHDCSCCRHFVKTMGNVVALKEDGSVTTIWDTEVTGTFYDVVTGRLDALVRRAPIENVFLHTEAQVGAAKTFQQIIGTNTATLSWDHFHLRLPASIVVQKDSRDTKLGAARSTHDVFERGLRELTLDALDTVIELTEQNSLYRAQESLAVVKEFRRLKEAYERLPALSVEGPTDAAGSLEQKRFAWLHSVKNGGAVTRLRNTAMGTLLQELSEGKDLEEAVKAYERIMAPTSYRRPTALVSKAMIAKAEATLSELGLITALERRYATIDDVSVNNVLFADRAVKRLQKSVFEELAAATKADVKKLDKVEEIGIEKFLVDVLPKAQALEVLVENRHAGNLVSLIAPVDPGAEPLFKWPNRFSWSYAGDVADSLKERVKAKGGNVTGDLRCSLSWFNYDDLDLHMVEPGGNRVYYGARRSLFTGGELDVDMNPEGGPGFADGRYSRSAVENIAYASRKRMPEGVYQLLVHNYSKMESVDVGFEVEVEFDGEVHSFSYDKAVRGGEFVPVAQIAFTRAEGFKVVPQVESKAASRTVWGVTTGAWARVSAVMLSPNYWLTDRQLAASEAQGGVGNKHYFFMLDGCRNEDKARGFYNEFLDARLNEHRKVLELVGARMKTDIDVDRQLSGVGFSSTQRGSLLVRVQGSFQRTVRVVF